MLGQAFWWIFLHLLLPCSNFIYTQWLRVPMPPCTVLSLHFKWNLPALCGPESMHILASVLAFHRVPFTLLLAQFGFKCSLQSPACSASWASWLVPLSIGLSHPVDLSKDATSSNSPCGLFFLPPHLIPSSFIDCIVILTTSCNFELVTDLDTHAK